MTARHKSKNKSKKQQRKSKPSAAEAPPRINQEHHGSRFGTIATVGAILISLIPLFPSLTAEWVPPYKRTDLVPTFAVTNDGFLPLTDVILACYIRKFTETSHKSNIGDLFVTPIGRQPSLDRNVPVTVPCGMSIIFSPSQVESMDIGILVRFHTWPWPFTYLKKQRVFRFVGTNDGEKLVWRGQPPNEMLPDLERHLRQDYEFAHDDSR